MIIPKVLASIHLHAILRNLEDLSELDPAVSDLFRGKSTGIRFTVPDLEPLTLLFADGRCKAIRGKETPAPIHLRFTDANHFNRMIEGKSNPIPTKGILSLGFLKGPFVEATDRLTSYLRPDPDRLKSDANFRKVSTLLTAYAAFFALSEIGNLDSLGKMNAARIEDGVINIEIKDTLNIYIEKADGRLKTFKGAHTNARAFMVFDTVETASGILTGTLDSFACIGQGKLAFFGRIPMIDNLNKLLSQVSAYLA